MQSVGPRGRFAGALVVSAALLAIAPTTAVAASPGVHPALVRTVRHRPATRVTSAAAVAGVAPTVAAGASNLYGWGSTGNDDLTAAVARLPVVIDRPIPVPLPAGTVITQVSAGADSYNAAITAAGEGLQWGFVGDYGPVQPTYPPPLPALTPLDLSADGIHHGVGVSPRQTHPATFLSVGQTHSEVVVDGRVFSWGYCGNGVLGIGDPLECEGGGDVPGEVVGIPAGDRVVATDAGNQYGMALTSAGQVYDWGSPLNFGRTDIFSAAALETHLPPGDPIAAVTGGTANALALGRSGRVYDLVDGALDASGHVEPVAGLPHIVSIEANEFTADAITASGQVYTWQPPVTYQRPALMTGFPAGVKIAQIAIGYAVTVARTTTGQVYTWGLDTAGELGNGTVTAPGDPVDTAPVHVTSFPAGTVITDVATDAFDVFAVAAPPTVTAVTVPRAVRVRPTQHLTVSATFDEAVQTASFTLTSPTGHRIRSWTVPGHGRVATATLTVSGSELAAAGVGHWSVQAGPGPAQDVVAVTVRADSEIALAARRRGAVVVVRGRVTRYPGTGSTETGWVGRTVLVQRRTGKTWRTVTRERTTARGQFGVDLPVAGAAAVRAVTTGTAAVWERPARLAPCPPTTDPARRAVGPGGTVERSTLRSSVVPTRGLDRQDRAVMTIEGGGASSRRGPTADVRRPLRSWPAPALEADRSAGLPWAAVGRGAVLRPGPRVVPPPPGGDVPAGWSPVRDLCWSADAVHRCTTGGPTDRSDPGHGTAMTSTRRPVPGTGRAVGQRRSRTTTTWWSSS